MVDFSVFILHMYVQLTLYSHKTVLVKILSVHMIENPLIMPS
jgi:hypothetical protein